MPWSDVHEIAAGSHVLWFRFATPVRVVLQEGTRVTSPIVTVP